MIIDVMLGGKMGFASKDHRKGIAQNRNLVLYLAIALASLLLLLFLVTDEWKTGNTVHDKKEGVASVAGEVDLSEASDENRGDSAPSVARTGIDSHLASLTLNGTIRARDNSMGIDGAALSVKLIPFNQGLGAGEAEADGEGRFSLTVPFFPEQRPRSIYLSLSADGFLDSRTSIPCPDKGLQVDLGSFYLRRDKEHRLKIVDESEKPISGALVRFMRTHHLGPTVEKRSDAAGFITVSDAELTRSNSSTWRFKRLNVVHLVAKGKADHIIYGFDWERPSSIEIQMQPAAIWSSRVLDRETGKPVVDARVALDFDRASITATVSKYIGYDEIQATTDAAGCFSMQKLTFTASGGRFLSFSCFSTEYHKFDARDEDISLENGFPAEIYLHRATDSRHLLCRAMDRETHQPLCGFMIHWSTRYQLISDEITDESGLFNFHNFDLESLRRRFPIRLFLTEVAHPQEKRAFYGILGFENMVDDVCEIPFQKILVESLTVGVRDESGQPVAGAHVEIWREIKERPGSWGSCSGPITDEEGQTVLDLWLIESMRLELRSINHHDYCPHPRVEFTVPFSESTMPANGMEFDPVTKVLWFTLRRGLLFQDIRVVNQNDEPLRDERVCGEINDVDMGGSIKKKLTIYGKTGQNGFCEMTFPFFSDGILYVMDRPDSIVHVDYDLLLKRQQITLYCFDEPSPDRSIQGIVRDEMGAPLKGVMVRIYELESGSRRITFADNKNRRTGDNGQFSFHVAMNRMYKLRAFSNITGSTQWTTVFEKDNLTAGECLDIKLETKEITGIQVRFGSFFNMMEEKYKTSTDVLRFWSFDYEAWLENESGERVEPYKTTKGVNTVSFRGIPESKIRVFVRAGTGEQCSTPILEIEQGRLFRYEMTDK